MSLIVAITTGFFRSSTLRIRPVVRSVTSADWPPGSTASPHGAFRQAAITAGSVGTQGSGGGADPSGSDDGGSDDGGCEDGGDVDGVDDRLGGDELDRLDDGELLVWPTCGGSGSTGATTFGLNDGCGP